MTASAPLPRWTDRPGHRKLEPLTGPGPAPEPLVRGWLADRAAEAGGPLRVLDVGAGRGARVAWLLEQGHDAVGVEVDAAYVERGHAHLPPERLVHVDPSSDYPLPEASFDVVLSDQVVEHVADLDAFVAQVARVSAPGAHGLHVFPATWAPVEGHLHMPLVHWVPKGRARRAWIRGALAVGAAAPYFTELAPRDRAAVFAAFSHDETFYRSRRELRTTFERHGHDVEVGDLARAKLGRLAVAAPLYTLGRAVYLTTRRHP